MKLHYTNFLIPMAALFVVSMSTVSCGGSKEEGEGTVTYTVTFDTRGGTPAVDPQDILAGGKATLPDPAPSKADSTLTGWFTVTGNEYNFATPVNSSFTLHARYAKAQTVTVTFVTNDPATTIPPVSVTKGTPVNKPTKYPGKSGHIFAGWFTDEACTQKFDFDMPVSADLTLYGDFMRRIKFTNPQFISQVTGGYARLANVPLCNNTSRDYDFGGTDLGIVFNMGDKVGVFFGDTYGGSGRGPAPDWRSNVLAFSDDTNLEDGFQFNTMALHPNSDKFAKELIPKAYAGGYTSIPTSAISIKGTSYVHYMNWIVAGGGEDKYFAEIYRSDDDGQNWTKTKVRFPRTSKFFLVAYEKDPTPGSDYIFMLGTHGSGNPGANPESPSNAYSYRASPVYLARFHETEFEQQNKYQYWNGSSWVENDESAAVPVIERLAGEASLMWHEKYQRWLYHSSGQGMYYAQAADITGPWYTDNLQLPYDVWGPYAAMFHKWFNKTDDIYSLMSIWGENASIYNVFLMKHNIQYAN